MSASWYQHLDAWIRVLLNETYILWPYCFIVFRWRHTVDIMFLLVWPVGLWNGDLVIQTNLVSYPYATWTNQSGILYSCSLRNGQPITFKKMRTDNEGNCFRWGYFIEVFIRLKSKWYLCIHLRWFHLPTALQQSKTGQGEIPGWWTAQSIKRIMCCWMIIINRLE